MDKNTIIDLFLFWIGNGVFCSTIIPKLRKRGNLRNKKLLEQIKEEGFSIQLRYISMIVLKMFLLLFLMLTKIKE